MADIPVERKGGSPWWVWLFALLAMIGLIWLIAELFDDEPDADDVAIVDPVEPIEEPEPMDVDTEVTSFAALANGTALIGREVDLEGMTVVSLTGDSSFVVAPGTGEGALIVLTDTGEWQVGPGTGEDGEYDINEGSTIDIKGTIRAFGETTPDYAEMSSADRDRAIQQGVYISIAHSDIQKYPTQSGPVAWVTVSASDGLRYAILQDSIAVGYTPREITQVPGKMRYQVMRESDALCNKVFDIISYDEVCLQCDVETGNFNSVACQK